MTTTGPVEALVASFLAALHAEIDEQVARVVEARRVLGEHGYAAVPATTVVEKRTIVCKRTAQLAKPPPYSSGTVGERVNRAISSGTTHDGYARAA